MLSGFELYARWVPLRILSKSENIINLSKVLDVHDSHRSASAANFIKCTDHRFTEKSLCKLKLMTVREEAS